MAAELAHPTDPEHTRFSFLSWPSRRPADAGVRRLNGNADVPSYRRIGGSGFDSTGEHLLAISHSGRGLFSAKTWMRIARDASLAYPEGGTGIGIGPIDGQQIPVTVMPFDIGQITVTSPDGRIILNCESDGISVSVTDT